MMSKNTIISLKEEFIGILTDLELKHIDIDKLINEVNVYKLRNKLDIVFVDYIKM